VNGTSAGLVIGQVAGGLIGKDVGVMDEDGEAINCDGACDSLAVYGAVQAARNMTAAKIRNQDFMFGIAVSLL
jgi:hypothetical protein